MSEFLAYHDRPELASALAKMRGKRFDGIAFARLFGLPPNTRKLSARRRKPSLDRVRKQAAKAGITVASYTVNPDGSITVVPGQPDTTTNNPWDEVLPHEPD